MKKIIFISDLHGNMPATIALEQQLNEIQPDDIWFLGDAVGKGPESDKTCDWVRKNCKHFIGGNWDYNLCKSFRGKSQFSDDFYWNQIGQERFAWLEKLPLEDEILISGLNFRIFHGRPADQLYFDYDDRKKLSKGFYSKQKNKTFNGFICADSHMPFIREFHSGYVLNCGSVGNTLGQPDVTALLIQGEPGSWEKSFLQMSILRIPYDNKLAAKIAGEYPELPQYQAFQKEVLTGRYSR